MKQQVASQFDSPPLCLWDNPYCEYLSNESPSSSKHAMSDLPSSSGTTSDFPTALSLTFKNIWSYSFGDDKGHICKFFLESSFPSCTTMSKIILWSILRPFWRTSWRRNGKFTIVGREWSQRNTMPLILTLLSSWPVWIGEKPNCPHYWISWRILKCLKDQCQILFYLYVKFFCFSLSMPRTNHAHITEVYKFKHK